MRSSILSGLLASGAMAFSDSSPFLMYSTSKLAVPSPNAQLQSTAQVLRAAHDLLASCPTSLYLIHTQPNAHASDLRDPQTGRCAAPSLCAAAAPAGGRRGVVQTTFGVAEVVGDVISAAELREYIEVACARAGREHSVAITQLDALPREDEERRDAVLRADKQIGQALNLTAEGQGLEADYTLIYFASPHEPSRSYEGDFSDSPAVQMELRRRSDVVLGRADDAKNITNAPLFVKYQFFTPGLFMAFVGALIMFSMLYVGLSAVASLQVSYGAFDKEMGPAAQKKNQ